jgi:hypothetical protein
MDETELLDADALSKSINGFDQIAIRQMFRERLDQVAADSTMFMRALLFVLAKRDGANDGDAYRSVMLLPLDEVIGRFKEADVDPEDEDAVAERDRQYADFVTACRLSFTVDQYMALTLGQKTALLDAAQRMRG